MDDRRNSKSKVGPIQKPESLSDVGVHQGVLDDLALKALYLFGPLSLLELSRHIRLSLNIVEELFVRMRGQQFCEVTGMSRNIPELSITSQGRSRAWELLSQCQYAGAAPVSLESYVNQVHLQSARHIEVHPPDVERAFDHLVLDSRILSQLGTGLNSGTSIFLYGPTGVGKTVIAETLSRVIAEDKVWIPYAVEVDGQIITVYDPVIHKAVSKDADWESDWRWVLCDRPAVLVGGELTSDMLNLQFNPITKFYVGPVQMKANNGVLIIDDFGRQRLQPEALLNRWIVPLDRRTDFLSLAGGKTIEMPFEILVVFSTNLDPSQLLDEAFLRRIHTKIKIGGVSDVQFQEIFRRVAREYALECDVEVLQEVVDVIGSHSELLRPCYARDLVNQIRWVAKYEGRKAYIDRAAVMRAAEAYFLSAP
jgi:predicted ATPase with chaperone activity